MTLSHQKLLIMLENERFYSTIISLKIGEQTQAAILKDVQRHPYKNAVLHIDFQRVEENEKIRISIPLHFKGESIAPGVKSQGGIVSHMRSEVEVSCLPRDLPEFIEVDISGLSLNESIHLSQLNVPETVQLLDLSKGDATVVAIHSPRAKSPKRRLRMRHLRTVQLRLLRQRLAAMRRRRPTLPRRTTPRRPSRPRKTPRSKFEALGKNGPSLGDGPLSLKWRQHEFDRLAFAHHRRTRQPRARASGYPSQCGLLVRRPARAPSRRRVS